MSQLSKYVVLAMFPRQPNFCQGHPTEVLVDSSKRQSLHYGIQSRLQDIQRAAQNSALILLHLGWSLIFDFLSQPHLNAFSPCPEHSSHSVKATLSLCLWRQCHLLPVPSWGTWLAQLGLKPAQLTSCKENLWVVKLATVSGRIIILTCSWEVSTFSCVFTKRIQRCFPGLLWANRLRAWGNDRIFPLLRHRTCDFPLQGQPYSLLPMLSLSHPPSTTWCCIDWVNYTEGCKHLGVVRVSPRWPTLLLPSFSRWKGPF